MSNGSLKTASFTVRATERQSLRWKRAAEGAGHKAVGSWIAGAVDAYLDALQRAGKPLPLAWRWGAFQVALLDGSEPELKGWLAPPFGVFRGSAIGPRDGGCRTFSLVYVPARRVLATLKSARQCQSLASDLARLWVRWGGSEPAENPAPVLDRHAREAV